MSTRRAKILIVDDEFVYRAPLKQILSKEHDVQEADSGEKALELIQKQNNFALIILDIKMNGGLDGYETLKKIKELKSEVEVIMYTSEETAGSVVNCIKLGAFDYIVKHSIPYEILLRKITNALESRYKRLENKSLLQCNSLLKQDNECLKLSLDRDFCSEIIGQSAQIQEIKKHIKMITSSSSNSNILIIGESGVGKEVVARAIHRYSRENDKYRPLVPVNVGAIDSLLIDSELFGHVKGAFTGAITAKRGLVELAEGGDLFLDEIGNLSWESQAKLLRALQEKEIKAVGCNETKKVNFRLISATNANLQEAILNKKFREDLYYRINVVTLSIPPLRERRDDIPLLINYLLDLFQQSHHKTIKGVSNEVLEHFLKHDWPGNIRELKNYLEKGMIYTPEGQVMRLSHVFPNANKKEPLHFDQIKKGEKYYKKKIEIDELETIQRAIKYCNGNTASMRRHLGMSRSMLYRRFKKYGIYPQSQMS